MLALERKTALRDFSGFSPEIRLGFGLQGLETRRENGSIATNFAVDVSHDPIGNRKTATEGAQQKTYNANSVNEYVTAGSASLTYDLDGNLTGDGTRRFVYDAENRLTLVEPVTAVNGSTRVRMAYDYLGRRVQKIVEEYDGSAWAAADDVRFVYMGWNVIEERKTSGGVTTKKNFVWGLDLSQSMDGAGGIGGLLAVVDQAGTQMAFLYDANGNVGQLVDEQGAVVARYGYDAFGQTLVAAGAAADENAWRFSTKYADQETALTYYGYRYYDAGLGRWVNRDPVGESGGLNLYLAMGNGPSLYVDPRGLTWLDDTSEFVAGAGDGMTMGLTSMVREQLGWNNVVDNQSGYYVAGEVTEFVVETVVTLGGAALRKQAFKYAGKQGRYILEKGARQSFRRAKGLVGKGGVIHHLNPIREGRFPLPFKFAARGFWNLKWLPGTSVSARNKLHRMHHWWLRSLDSMDVVRTWTSPIRTLANEIMRHVNSTGSSRGAMAASHPGEDDDKQCLYAPDITIEVNVELYGDDDTGDIPGAPIGMELQ